MQREIVPQQPRNPFQKALDGPIKPFNEFEADMHRALWESILNQTQLFRQRKDQQDGDPARHQLVGGVTSTKTRCSKKKKQGADDAASDTPPNYGRIYHHLGRLVVAQPEPLQRLRSRLNAHENQELDKLVREGGPQDQGDEGEDTEGEGAQKKPKETDMDLLRRLLNLLRRGEWNGKLMSRLPSQTETTDHPDGNKPSAIATLEEDLHEFAQEVADFPFAELYEELTELVELDSTGQIVSEVKKSLGSIRESLRLIPSKEKAELDRLLALTNHVIDSGWQSPWMAAMLEREEEERHRIEAEKKKAASAAAASRKKKRVTPPDQKNREEHIGGTEFRRPPVSKPLESPMSIEKEIVPPPEMSPITKLLATLTVFITKDTDNTIRMLCLPPAQKGRLLEILQADESDKEPVGIDPARETRDLATFKEILDILSTGQWQHRALVKDTPLEYAAYLRESRDDAAPAVSHERKTSSRGGTARKVDAFIHRPVCPSKVRAKSVSFAEPDVLRRHDLDGSAATVKEKIDHSFGHKEGHEMAPCDAPAGKKHKRRPSPSGHAESARSDAHESHLPLLPDLTVLRIMKATNWSRLRLAPPKVEDASPDDPDDWTESSLSGNMRDHILDRFNILDE